MRLSIPAATPHIDRHNAQVFLLLGMTELQYIRNFSIIAHIDHGKSTLADRFIQVCGGLSQREMAEQVLDSMDLERERGITIKAQSVTLYYPAADGNRYQLNFIDTPGHVDFSYEVSRSLAACEGALLVVDAAQGVEAQSVANCYTAIEQGLEVVPVLNKVDLPAAEPERVITEIEEIIGIDASDAIRVSAKTGVGIPELLERLIQRIPPPGGDASAPLQALIIDSWFDSYVGVISLIRVVSGVLRPKEKIWVMSTGRTHLVDELGVFSPKRIKRDELSTGEVGFVIAGIKEIDGAPVGDTITHATDGPAPSCRDLPRCAPVSFRDSTRSAPMIMKIFAMPCTSSSSMMPPFTLSRRPRRPSASAFAAASSGCSTWRSSKSGWSGSMTST